MRNSIKKILTYNKAYIPGLLIFTAFFTYTIIFNMSFAYMGNTSISAVYFILSHYIFLIILYFLKIMIVYAVLGIAMSVFFYYGIRSMYLLLVKSYNQKIMYVSTALLTFIIAFSQLCKSIISHPQLYLETIYNKNIAFKYFQIFLTNNLSPGFFSVVQGIILFPFIIALVLVLYHNYRRHYDTVIQRLIVTISSARYIIPISSIIIIILIMTLTMTISHNKITGHPNILILSSDALRPDYFSGYGHHRPTTPHIDTLIKKGTSFRNVYTVVPRTFPSWVSILTSQLPYKHNITHMFPTAKARRKDFVTLPAILSKHGYYTSVIGDFAADIFPRIDLGYDTVIAPTFNMKVMLRQIILKNHVFLMPFLTNDIGFYLFPEIRGFAEFADPQYVIDDITDEIDKSINRNKPFFITSFFSITHFPYPAPYPHYNLFTDRSYTGPFKYAKNRVVSLDTNAVQHKPDTFEIEHIRALYEGCLFSFDAAVGKLVEYLKKKDIYDETIIIILSDHGENLFEWEYGMGHGEHLRGKYSLIVPFIVSGPDIGNAQHHDVRSTIDIAPTILDLLAIPQPPSFDGTSLFKSHNRSFDAYSETGIWFDNTGDFFFQKKRIMYPDITGISTIDFNYHHEITIAPYYENIVTIAKHRSIIDDNRKLIYMPTHHGIEYELYDLSKDPEERNNIFLASPQSAEMKRRFFSLFKTNPHFKIYNDYLIPLPLP